MHSFNRESSHLKVVLMHGKNTTTITREFNYDVRIWFWFILSCTFLFSLVRTTVKFIQMNQSKIMLCHLVWFGRYEWYISLISNYFAQLTHKKWSKSWWKNSKRRRWYCNCRFIFQIPIKIWIIHEMGDELTISIEKLHIYSTRRIVWIRLYSLLAITYSIANMNSNRCHSSKTSNNLDFL